VTTKNPIDRRPFQSKADHQMQMALENQYRGVAIPQVVAILESGKPSRTPRQQAQSR